MHPQNTSVHTFTSCMEPTTTEEPTTIQIIKKTSTIRYIYTKTAPEPTEEPTAMQTNLLYKVESKYIYATI